VRPQQRGLGSTLRLTAGIAIGLLFIIGPLADLLHSSLGGLQVAAIAAGLAVFIGLYATVMQPGRVSHVGPAKTLAILGVLALLPAAMLVAGAPQSFALLFVFFVAAAGMRLQPRAAAVVIVVTAVVVGALGAAEDESGSATSARVLTVLAIGAMMTAFNRQIRVNRQLQAARDEIARLAVTDERLRIARDLHDLLGHSLSVINLKSELAAKLVQQDPQRAAAELADVQAVGRQALAEVREAVQGYRQLALADALAGARTALDAAGIECELDEPPALPPEIDEVFAWAVREGTTNVVRHSGAGRCAVRISENTDEAVVEVEDDGASPPSVPHAGSGLRGLTERAARLRGTVEAGAAPGGGFRLRLVVPRPA
jgi:two-component system sensor histidine kinase DesK